MYIQYYKYQLLLFVLRDQAIFIAGMGPVQMGMGHWFFLTLHIYGANIWDAHGTNTFFDALFCGWIFLNE
jgi:hypothetical protein